MGIQYRISHILKRSSMERIYNNCKVCGGEIALVNKEFNLAKCHSCQLVFSKSKFTDEEFVEKYKSLYNQGDKPQYFKHSSIEFNNLKKGTIKIGFNRKYIISKEVKKSHSVLEIGSGIGLIGCYLKQKVKLDDYLGIEIDQESHEKALSLGVHSISGDFKKMDSLSASYDVIMLWEVMEHIQDLDALFVLMKERLKNDGKILFSVPNFNKRLNYENYGDKIFQSGPPIHLNFFTKESIVNTLNRYGFEAIDIREKKLPYFNLSKTYFKSLLKVFSFRYHGSTIYVSAKNKM